MPKLRAHRYTKIWRVGIPIVVAGLLVFSMSSVAHANLSGSTFEGNDGNLVVNTTGNTDWVNAPARVTGTDLSNSKLDNAFGQGTKEDDPAVTVVNGSIPPNKNDLTRFYVASEFASGSNFLYLSWERAVNIGAANLDFELNQNVTAGLFGEAAINLTAAGVFPAGTCEAFGSTFLKSRSSSSFPAEIKDFVAPQPVNISNCGTIIVKKVTVPSPDPTDTSFAFTLTGGPSAVNKSFNLKNGDSNETDNLLVGSGYAAAETVPANWALTSATCDDGSPVSNISLSPGEVVTCTFTNTLQTGAIQVTKTRKHAADGTGDHPQAGVSFTVGGVTKQTDSNGVACFDGLLFGTYTVHETVPAGYHVDANDKQVTVDNTATCSGSPYVGETVSFHNTPLTDITVSVNSQVDGGTASTVTCTPAGPSGSSGANGDFSGTTTDLEPGTYTCTIVVDP